MDQSAITKAKSRLRVAKGALEDLEACENYESFMDKWYVFLTSAKNVYTVLEQGAKVSPQSRQWFGAKKGERRSDPLLRYVYEARNDDEHGLEPGSEEVPARVAIGGAGDRGYSQSFSINGSLEEGLNVTSLDGKRVQIAHTPRHIRLIKVHDRSKVAYDPPNEHLGKPLQSNLPLPVAKLAYAYLQGIVEEAEKLV